MRKILIIFLLTLSLSSFAIEPATNLDFSSSGKSFNLLFNLTSLPSYYNYNAEEGLGYVKEELASCKRYQAKCHIEVVIHYQAFPIVLKTENLKAIKPEPGVNYDYSLDIRDLVAGGVKFFTSSTDLTKYKLNRTSLIPGVGVVDSSTLYIASKAAQGYYVFGDNS